MKSFEWYKGKEKEEQYKDVKNLDFCKLSYPDKNLFKFFDVVLVHGENNRQATCHYSLSSKQVHDILGDVSMPNATTPLKEFSSKDTKTSGTIKYVFAVEEYNSAVKEYYDNSEILYEQFKKDLEDEHLPDSLTKAADIIFSEAYDKGHSAGFSEVHGYYLDVVDFAEKIIRSMED